MKRILACSIAAATFLVPVASTAAQAAPHASRTTLVSAQDAQGAARETAARLADAAPWLSAAEKHSNARTVAAIMDQPGISQGERAIAVGKTQLGTMYRWGGTTSEGFDCSGFTQYVYARIGKKIPRTAAMQYGATERTTDPQPGDLIFFGGERAHHVAIYLGDDKMLHSPRTGMALQVAPLRKGGEYGKVR